MALRFVEDTGATRWMLLVRGYRLLPRVLSLVLCLALPVFAMAAVETTQGKLPDGTPYRIDFPEKWNGTVLIGLDYAGGRDPLGPGEFTAANRALIERGFALAGTSRVVAGWAIQLSAANAIRTLDIFEAKYGKAKHAVEYGASMGGHTAAVSIQAYPDRWNGAVIQCGGLAGSVGQWQGKMDALFVAKALLAPDSTLPVTGIPKDFQTTALPAWKQMLSAANDTPEGRARIALAAMMGQLPDWADRNSPPPAADDLDGREKGLYMSLANGLVPQAMSSRSQIETLSGGNISSNVGVNYATVLKTVDPGGLIAKLYKRAGISLDADLAKLAHAPRIAADPAAIAYVASGVFDGRLKVPVITESGLGDPISSVAAQQAYQAAVDSAGRSELLRQVYTTSVGHCGFTASESVAAVETLIHRLDTGKWEPTTAAAMNKSAGELALGRSRFVDYSPTTFARPYTACTLDKDLETAKIKPLLTTGQTLPACQRGSR